MKKLICCAIFFTIATVQAQSNKPSTPPINWQLMDWQQDGYPGISLEKAYNELLKNKKPITKVVVAVIDLGLEDTHPDLAGMEWINKKEIPGNNIDDDHNGFVDDVHGWNFSGNAITETWEPIREYVRLRHQFENITDSNQIKNNSLYDYWVKVVKEKELQLNMVTTVANTRNNHLLCFRTLYNYWNKKLPNDPLYIRDIKNREPEQDADSSVKKAYQYLREVYFKRPRTVDDSTMISLIYQFEDGIAKTKITLGRVDTIIKKNDPAYFRKKETGDDPYSNTIHNYGNNDTWPIWDHGTLCTGVIAALRNNNIGMNGITNSVEIMPVRIFAHEGDEWDKDVANAILYAADNGAKVISMSISKKISPQKKWVDDAIRHAEQKGVLFINAAGNSSSDNDLRVDYPEPFYLDRTRAANMIKVGASAFDSSLVASFSCYGKHTVDVFAPGLSIYTTTLQGQYATVGGTSFACPIVAGLAALLWSYYPKLNYKQVKECIEQSATPINTLVTKPGTDEKVLFSTLSRTGGIVNAYNAVKLADEIIKQKK